MTVPGSLLRELGVTPSSTDKFRMADGGIRYADVAYTWIRANGREMITFIAFDDDKSDPIMGRLAINSLRLRVDPVARKLAPMTSIPL